MAEEQQQTNPQDEDEISLIDLFVVVLKHRRLIIISTVVALAVTAFYTLAKDFIAEQRIEDTERTETIITFMVSPSIRALMGNAEIESLISQTMLDPINIYDALREADIDEIGSWEMEKEDRVDQKNLYAIRGLFVEKKTAAGTAIPEKDQVFLITRNNYALNLIFRFPDTDKATVFLNYLYRTAEKSVHSIMEPIAKKEIADYERLLAFAEPSQTVQSSIAARYPTYSTALRYINKEEAPILVIREPYYVVSDITKGILVKFRMSIISVFAILFLSVFLAFVMEYVERVKADPEAIGKIETALKYKRKK